MTERWRKPVRIDSIQPSGDVVLIGDRLVQEEEVILADPQDLVRMRQGYVCPNCFEPFETPYPERCVVCGLNVRQAASQFLEQHYQGETFLGPRESYDDEIASMQERSERKKHNKRSSIVLPREL